MKDLYNLLPPKWIIYIKTDLVLRRLFAYLNLIWICVYFTPGMIRYFSLILPGIIAGKIKKTIIKLCNYIDYIYENNDEVMIYVIDILFLPILAKETAKIYKMSIKDYIVFALKPLSKEAFIKKDFFENIDSVL